MIIRRAARFGAKIGLHEPFLARVAEQVIERYGVFYPELMRNRNAILDNLTREEERFLVLADGFQHRALARDFDLVLVDDRARTLLPAGPMRECRRALTRAHAIAWVRRSGDDPSPGTEGLGGWLTQPIFPVRFAARALVESQAGVWHELPVQRLSGRRVATVVGIANPTRFYATVRQWEAQIHDVFEFPDHYHYRTADWQRISRQTRDVDLIVTTAKDLVKLEAFPFARGKLVALRIRPEIDGADALVRLIMERTGLAPEEPSAERVHWKPLRMF